jgi:hypothetical protein
MVIVWRSRYYIGVHYIEHIPGRENCTADILSHWHTITNPMAKLCVYCKQGSINVRLDYLIFWLYVCIYLVEFPQSQIIWHKGQVKVKLSICYINKKYTASSSMLSGGLLYFLLFTISSSNCINIVEFCCQTRWIFEKCCRSRQYFTTKIWPQIMKVWPQLLYSYWF